MKILRTAFFAFCFAAFLSLGMRLGRQWSLAASPLPVAYSAASASQSLSSSPAPQTQNPVITITSPPLAMEQRQQHSAMLITVDESANPAPRLVSIWYFVIYPDDDSVTLMPVFPSINPEHQEQNRQLAENFHLTEGGLPDPSSLQQIHDLGIIWHGEYALFHENAVSEIATFLVGPDLQYKITDIQALTTWEADALTAIQAQAALLQELCNATSLAIDADHIVTFIGALAPHLKTNLAPERIRADWQHLAAYGHQLNCEFPSLTR